MGAAASGGSDEYQLLDEVGMTQRHLLRDKSSHGDTDHVRTLHT